MFLIRVVAKYEMSCLILCRSNEMNPTSTYLAVSNECTKHHSALSSFLNQKLNQNYQLF